MQIHTLIEQLSAYPRMPIFIRSASYYGARTQKRHIGLSERNNHICLVELPGNKHTLFSDRLIQRLKRYTACREIVIRPLYAKYDTVKSFEIHKQGDSLTISYQVPTATNATFLIDFPM